MQNVVLSHASMNNYAPKHHDGMVSNHASMVYFSWGEAMLAWFQVMLA